MLSRAIVAGEALSPRPARDAGISVSAGVDAMSVRYIEPKSRFEAPDDGPRRPRNKPINIQDSFLFGSLKEARVLAFALVTGKAIKGRIKRFDRYAVVVESGSQEILIYKHAIAGITEVAE